MDLQWMLERDGNFDITSAQENTKGFGGMTLRAKSGKPIIAAVNGMAFGGGFEIVLSCDIVVATCDTRFSLPEPKVGLAALAGGVARLVRYIGYPRAMEIALTARTVSAAEGKEFGFVNYVVNETDLMDKAMSLAQQIAALSPDSIIVTKELGQLALKKGSIYQALVDQQEYYRIRELTKGENAKEGVKAFREKRKPQWVPSKL
eukprot:TRINITY_DN4142_c0_g2_i1.p1 TRINITY_DN4142_c0_g2~~TRINITY_DN4142_c0_g2_i1.p1  ORF type:complete len:204 (-),score=49.50 TRINITY_DN4142_c0_g2_i1:108-719(-)